jgi:hypothetical protein
MVQWLQYVGEPTDLILAWQADDRTRIRFRWAVARLRREGEGCVLSYLDADTEFPIANQGRKYGEILDLGYRGYPGFKPSAGKRQDGVLSSLMRRLPPRTRSDFGAYLRHFRVPPGKHLSDFALLGLTEAKLPNDGFSIVDPLHGYSPPSDLLCEVAGYRYYVGDLQDPQIGALVSIVPEPDNEHDENAVKFVIEGAKVGNVNRLQTATFLRWISTCSLDAHVERVNGTVNRPRLYVMTKVRDLSFFSETAGESNSLSENQRLDAPMRRANAEIIRLKEDGKSNREVARETGTPP